MTSVAFTNDIDVVAFLEFHFVGALTRYDAFDQTLTNLDRDVGPTPA
jgi:hypothetical protein